jgi:hypothetical protein
MQPRRNAKETNMRYAIPALLLVLLAGCAATATDSGRVYYDRKYNTVTPLRAAADSGAASVPLQRRGSLNPNQRYQ